MLFYSKYPQVGGEVVVGCDELLRYLDQPLCKRYRFDEEHRLNMQCLRVVHKSLQLEGRVVALRCLLICRRLTMAFTIFGAILIKKHLKIDIPMNQKIYYI